MTNTKTTDLHEKQRVPLVYLKTERSMHCPNIVAFLCTMPPTDQWFSTTQSTSYVSVVYASLTVDQRSVFTNVADSRRALVATHCGCGPEIRKSEKSDHSQTLWRWASHTRWRHRDMASYKAAAFLSVIEVVGLCFNASRSLRLCCRIPRPVGSECYI